MVRPEEQITEAVKTCINAHFEMPAKLEINLQETRKEFPGEITLLVFPFTKFSRKNPEETGAFFGDYLKENIAWIKGYNVVKGFLNLETEDSIWQEVFSDFSVNSPFVAAPQKGEKVMVEYSSPNTNKPLHLGHLRNNFLGYSVASIMQHAGYEVVKANLVNDRGIHICKSMLAYERYGKGETPADSGLKGDRLVGDYYVKFDQENKKQTAERLAKLKAEKPDADPEKLAAEAEKFTELNEAAREMLRKWEAGDEATVNLWKKMNGWVYDGFDKTYALIGVNFDQTYYESNTYLLGKKVVEEGLSSGVFFTKDDGSVWIDMAADKLDEKLLLRPDGTSVYMTQDIGTADLKFADYGAEKSVYVVGNEQDYHFKVLKIIMKRLGRSYADGIFHLSYGMVELPSGKMKSREGTVVDADDLVIEMIKIASERTAELGKIEGFSQQEAVQLFRQLALGALKYYLLRVDPKRKMMFNPEESIDFQGDTGVYIQYTHAKICSLLRRAKTDGISYEPKDYANISELDPSESELVRYMVKFPAVLQSAARNYAPSEIANYAYELARAYSRFYSSLSVFGEEDAQRKAFRVALSAKTAEGLAQALALLGIEAPERM